MGNWQVGRQGAALFLTQAALSILFPLCCWEIAEPWLTAGHRQPGREVLGAMLEKGKIKKKE